jgi:type IV pilus assembly protein PilC
MPKFSYSAIDVAGNTVTGVERSDSAGGVRKTLHQRDLQPIDVREKPGLLQIELTKEKLPKKHLMHFSRQLAVFLRAGIPILEALEAIGDEASHKVLRRVLTDLGDLLRGGATFADACAAHPEAFPALYVAVLQSAELTGNLDSSLDELAEYIERDVETRQKLISALIYPVMVMGLSIVVAVILTVFVLPRFADFFESLDAELPLPTRMLLATADFIGAWGWLVGLLAAVTVIGGGIYIRTKPGRRLFDRILLKVPSLGDLMRHAILERLCRVLSSMLGAGVPLPDALSVTADVTNNFVYQTGINGARDAMIRGEGLARPLAETNLFPSSARQMFRVGEETGTLDTQLHTAAVYFHRELDFKIKKFTGLFEPLVIIFMGVVVGFVALALISAMYGIFNQVQT